MKNLIAFLGIICSFVLGGVVAHTQGFNEGYNEAGVMCSFYYEFDESTLEACEKQLANKTCPECDCANIDKWKFFPIFMFNNTFIQLGNRTCTYDEVGENTYGWTCGWGIDSYISSEIEIHQCPLCACANEWSCEYNCDTCFEIGCTKPKCDCPMLECPEQNVTIMNVTQNVTEMLYTHPICEMLGKGLIKTIEITI